MNDVLSNEPMLFVKNNQSRYGYFTCPLCKCEGNLWKWSNGGGLCEECGEYFQVSENGEHIRCDDREYCDMLFEVDHWQG